MKKKYQNKGMVAALIIFFILMVGDIISTLINGDLVQYLEANPVYKYGGLPLIFLINVLLILFVYRFYNKTNRVSYRFGFIHYITSVNVVRIFVIKNNIQIYLNPPTIEVAKQVTQAAKNQAMINVFIPFLVAFLVALVSYFFFKYDHKIEAKPCKSSK